MLRKSYIVAVLLIVLSPVLRASAEDQWPHWRGPHYNGTSAATRLPVSWSETENIAWKVPMPAWSGASPIVWGDRIFVSSPSKGETTPEKKYMADGDPGGKKLLLLCLSRMDGTTLWERELDEGNVTRRKQNMSSPSPLTDGSHVWAVTGTGTVTALDMDGQILWKMNLQTTYGKFGQMFGYASSPILYKGKLILQVLHGYETDDPSYLLALDPLTGKVLWRVERPTDAPVESPDAYNTPTLLEWKGKAQIIVAGGDYVTGHDPENGAEMWRLPGLNLKRMEHNRIVASPLAVDGMVFVPNRQKPLLALDLQKMQAGGTPILAWQWDQPNGPDVPTPVSDGTLLYLIEDRGIVTAVEPKTGKVVYGPEHTSEGTVSASPLLADGKIYVTNEDGVTTVVTAGPAFKILATNKLPGGYTLSSIAVAGQNLFLRTAEYLYCIGSKPEK